MIALTLAVDRTHAELVLANLSALAPGGFEERDTAEGVEYVLYGEPASLPSEDELATAAGDALISITAAAVADDWSERWKRWHRPVDVSAGGRTVRVRPPWEPAAGDGVIDIVIDPGQAFGTGGHHTTRLCLELLLELEPAGSLADWGCGSGVLALAAAKLGWLPVSAVDFDPAAVAATRANATANAVDALHVGHADLASDPGPTAGTVVANLMTPLLLRVAERLVDPPGDLIISGLLREQADEVAGAFARRDLEEAARRSSGEWSALRLRRA